MCKAGTSKIQIPGAKNTLMYSVIHRYTSAVYAVYYIEYGLKEPQNFSFVFL
uniref:Uncharacterized protein n=1 Tax=Solanum tuberosum TaxID=4113 RepID=M1BR31_SOLTU